MAKKKDGGEPRTAHKVRHLRTVRFSDVKARGAGFRINEKKKTLDFNPNSIYRQGYWIELKRLDTPEKLLGFVSHVAKKPRVDGFTVSKVVQHVSSHFGWEIHCW